MERILSFSRNGAGAAILAMAALNLLYPSASPAEIPDAIKFAIALLAFVWGGAIAAGDRSRES